MTDAINTAGGANPPVSPVDAGNPGNPPVNPTDTPPKDQKPAEKVSNATHARLRIAEGALKRRMASEKQSAPPPDDGIDPLEKEIIGKVVEQKFGHLNQELSELRSESDTKAIQQEVEETIKNSPYGEYLTADEKDRVHQLSLDDKYVNLPIDQLITLSISGRVVEIGAQMAQKASAKINDSKIPTSGSSLGNQGSDQVRDPSEWAKERAKLGFR